MALIEKINELINEITIEKLSSISGENKTKIEESLKACITSTLYSLLNKDSEDLSSVISIAKNVLEFPNNGQNYSILLKTIFGNQLEFILNEISNKTNTKIETVHLVSNSGVICIFRAIESLVPNFEMFFIKNFLAENQVRIKSNLPGYIDKKELEKKPNFDKIISNI